MRTIKEIILHCSATPEGVDCTIEEINSWHRARGWNKIGYHYVIYRDGSVHVGRKETENGVHCKGHNKNSIGICYVGGCPPETTSDWMYKNKDTRTPEQKQALIQLVKQLMEKYSLSESQVHCHNEFANKACPSFSISTFRNELRAELNSINNKQTKSINSTVFKKFKRGWLGHKTKWTISSPMGMRIHPKKKKRRFHGGNDISTPMGTKIYAPCDGTIEKRIQKGGAGLYVILKASNGYYFYFMHLSEVVKTGTVREGDLIAKTGGDPRRDPINAGCSTGPHLHFEVRFNGDKSKRVDGKYFVTDTWVSKYTGAIMTSSSEDYPLITDNPDNYSENQQMIINEQYLIDEGDEVSIQEQDISGETDWEATEDIEEDDIVKERSLEEGFVSGIWQIMKLIIDEDVANLRIRDAATSLQQGSLINFFQKVCQQPFVEFFGDTYGDQYYFIARKPPFDKEGMKKTMIAQGLFDDTIIIDEENKKKYNGKNVFNKTVYDIYEDDIVSSNISFNTQNIYSWYQFIPIYELASPSELQYIIPAILFPEYAALWGSRSLVIRSQYRNFQNSNISDSVKNNKQNKQGDSEVRHSIHDLKYLIESNAYNPFVRQGTITILGNRKIKRGTFIRVFWNSLSCPEVFYIENIAQNYSIATGRVNRTTTLSLSHGMLSSYMFDNARESTKVGLEEDSSKDNRTTLSYFNIIDFVDYDKNNANMDNWREIISKWKVNINVFMFFLRKMQFANQIENSFKVIGHRKTRSTL